MEKRQFQRIDKIIQIKYESHDSIVGLPESSFTRDISAGGFRLRVKDKLQINEELNLKFYIGTEEFISAKAVVVRIDTVVENKLYNAGVKLVQIKDDDYKLLVDYLNANTIKA